MDTKSTTPEVLTTDEVAEIFRVHKATVIRMIERGQIDAVKVGHNWRITRAEVERVLGGGA